MGKIKIIGNLFTLIFAGSEVYTTFAAANTGVAQLVEHRSPKPGVGSSSLSSRANIFEMKKIVAYFKETYDELVHKVSWPTYSELANSAVVVLYASLLIALVVWGMDVCFQNFMEKIVYPH